MQHDLIEQAERWIAHDPDSNTQNELRRLTAAAREGNSEAQAELKERFSGPLTFGTAGLRGILGAGESRMNCAVVIRATAGLAHYLLEKVADKTKKNGVVIGYDGRHQSLEFAREAACVLAALSIPSYLSPIPCPTPICAFAVNHLSAAAGIMITASHNPPEYNGYKVYWTNGAQIIPPHDKGIAQAINACPPANEIARAAFADAVEQALVRDFPQTVEQAYLKGLKAQSVRKDGDRSLRIVYTPLHGVGNRLVRQALANAGFTQVITVPEQAEPDGDFPTVAFPNPEEKGAMDLAFALARKEDADLILANDPDVDRLAVAVKKPGGDYVQLSGNQVGILLGHYLLTEDRRTSGGRLVIASCVSSPMLGAIAHKLSVQYEETLTGFKWIANRAMDIEWQTGARFIFGFEEALGYTVGSLVHDKDGIGALVIMAEHAAVSRLEGMTLLDELEVLARRYGLFVSEQRSLTFPGVEGLEKIGRIMQGLRNNPLSKIGNYDVGAWSDYQTGKRTTREGGLQLLVLPKTNMYVYELVGGSRIIARPSGTEPKIKFYFDVREEMTRTENVKDAEQRARDKMKALADTFCTMLPE